MKKIIIAVVFDKSGSGSINVIPSTYPQWNPTQSSSQSYSLAPGFYNVTYLTLTDATGKGGSITVTDATGHNLGSAPLSPGADGGNFNINVI